MAARLAIEVSVDVPTWRFRVVLAWARFCTWSLDALAEWAVRGIKVTPGEGSD
jgi:hypothetical protein